MSLLKLLYIMALFGKKKVDKYFQCVIVNCLFERYRMNIRELKNGDEIFVICNGEITKETVAEILFNGIAIRTEDGGFNGNGRVFTREYIFESFDSALAEYNNRFNASMAYAMKTHNEKVAEFKKTFSA